METKLERIASKSANCKRPEFTSLYHLINKEMLMQCHKELDGSKAVGIDDITKREYSENLDSNIENLLDRLKRKSYKPMPSLRVYIPKSNGKMRPLGIACYEDKIVQLALKKILEAIYEPKFLNYYIKDKNILWLVKKYLKAGIIDKGQLVKSNEGTAQGNIISPVLANIYMHNALTLWFQYIIARECKGECFLVVYADDFIAGFEYPWEAEAFYEKLKNRMAKFGLELEDSKSRIVESGRYLANIKQSRGETTKMGTFDFLGFTFYCGKTKTGKPWIMPKTSSKKFRQKIKEMKIWLNDNKEQKLGKLICMLNIKLIGHYRYYGISFNSRMISNFKQQVRELLFRALNRRSQMKSYTKEGFCQMMKYYKLALPKIYVSLF